MHTLNVEQMDAMTGGGFWCGVAVGATIGGGIFGGPLLAGYLLSKAIGVCLIEAAV